MLAVALIIFSVSPGFTQLLSYSLVIGCREANKSRKNGKIPMQNTGQGITEDCPAIAINKSSKCIARGLSCRKTRPKGSLFKVENCVCAIENKLARLKIMARKCKVNTY
jgi:hypothetical protein